MRVWTIVMSQRLEDAENTRSMLLARALVKRGHEVTMWTSAFDHVHKSWRDQGRDSYVDDGMIVRFMKGSGYTENVSPQRYLDHWQAARDLLRRSSGLPKPDLIVANIPDHFTAYAGSVIARRTDAALVVDVRDKWPGVLYDHISNPVLRAVANAAFSYDTWKSRTALRRADAIVTMMDSFMQWALAQAGRSQRPTDRVFYLNTAERQFDVALPPLPAESRARQALEAVGNRFCVAFVGTFNRTQHPSLFLDAIEIIHRERLAAPEEIAFVVGGGGLEQEEVEARCRQFPNVYFAGWLNRSEIDQIVARADAGAVPFAVRTEALNNKIFAYLSGGAPLISSASGDVQQLIEERRIGLDFEAGNPRAMAEAILALHKNPALHAEMRANAKRFFLEALDRDTTYRQYADLLEDVTREHAARRAGTPQQVAS